MENSRLQQLLKKFENGECTEEELMLLYRLFDSFQFGDDRGQQVSPEARGLLRQEIFNRIDKGIRNWERRQLLRKWMRQAAVWLLVMAGLGAVFRYLNFSLKTSAVIAKVVKETASGQKLTVRLPDGSIVQMNAESRLEYMEGFTADRSVRLSGEAFFNVKKNPDRPFVISTGDVKTTVLGTSFNINAYPEQNEIKVTVASGKVAVQAEGKGVELRPGDQASYWEADHSITTRQVDVAHFLAWKRGILVFDGSSLVEVVSALERWYGVSIVLDLQGEDHCELRLTLDNLSLEESLQQIALLAGIHYEFTAEKQVAITGNPCQ